MKLTIGVRYMLLATFFFAMMNAGVKFLSNIPPVEIVFFRSIISFAMSLAILKSKSINPFGKPENRRWLIIRGLAGSTALILYFITLQNMPLASAVTIQFLSPIFTTILGIFIVREMVAKRQWVYFLIAFIGVLIIQGVDTRITPFYLLLGILASIFSGVAYNMIRKLGASENAMVIIFYFPLVTVPLTAFLVLYDWVTPQGYDWLIILFVGIATQTAQYFMTRAFQTEELSKISSLRYIGIVYALSFGYVLFGETFTLQSYLGMTVVLTGVFLNIRFKSKNTTVS